MQIKDRKIEFEKKNYLFLILLNVFRQSLFFNNITIKGFSKI